MQKFSRESTQLIQNILRQLKNKYLKYCSKCAKLLPCARFLLQYGHQGTLQFFWNGKRSHYYPSYETLRKQYIPEISQYVNIKGWIVAKRLIVFQHINITLKREMNKTYNLQFSMDFGSWYFKLWLIDPIVINHRSLSRFNYFKLHFHIRLKFAVCGDWSDSF